MDIMEQEEKLLLERSSWIQTKEQIISAKTQFIGKEKSLSEADKADLHHQQN